MWTIKFCGFKQTCSLLKHIKGELVSFLRNKQIIKGNIHMNAFSHLLSRGMLKYDFILKHSNYSLL